MLQRFRDDLREFPATMSLGAAWIVVFVLMLVDQYQVGRGLSVAELILGLRNGHRFGDMTLQELVSGEIWRTLTSTFVHYGLLHIGLNLYAFYQLGCLVESWYGAGQFLGIYVVTGGGGNLLSGLVRTLLHHDRTIPSGGGSVVVMGLVGLCAVVGWRARTHVGEYLKKQMIGVLVLTAAIGLLLPLMGLPIVDNWGHACGTLMGALVGLANRRLVAHSDRRSGRWIGYTSLVVLVASGAVQVRDDRKETVERDRISRESRERWAECERWLLRIDEIRQVYRVVATNRVVPRGAYMPPPSRPDRDTTRRPPPAAPSLGESYAAEIEFYRAIAKAAADALGSLGPSLSTGPTATDFTRSLAILERTRVDPPAFDELREFDGRMQNLWLTVQVERDRARFRALTSGLRARLR